MFSKFKHKSEFDLGKQELAKIFFELEEFEDAPLKMALASYENLKAGTKSTEDFFYYLIEDSIFTSLYATFYERIFMAINQYPERALELVESFSADSDEREQVIATQTQQHLAFVENYGMCSGCGSCEYHQDVAELIAYYQKGDIDFFTELYIGMQTIQFAMEYFLYDYIPSDPKLVKLTAPALMQNWRELIYNYAKLKAREL
ncbi:hypothetical protein ABMA79_04430 [Halobacteriovorax sp. HFRX-2_2]|uniref:hypothetical protein n=1 Tax=unclassified Halobacteriovorax TaxID=2639665 RepID=UPI0037216FE7